MFKAELQPKIEAMGYSADTVALLSVLVIAALCGVSVLLIDYLEIAIRNTKTRKREKQFLNTPYLCENESCSQHYFRMHHVFHAYTSGRQTLFGDEKPDIATYAQTMPAWVAEEMGIVLCPACGEPVSHAAREYEWMQEDSVMEPLRTKAVNLRKDTRNHKRAEKKLQEKLKTIEQSVHDMEAIAAYQLHLGVNSPVEFEIGYRIQNIKDQLVIIQRETPSEYVKQQAAALIHRLNQTGTKRFIEDDQTQPTPTQTKIESQAWRDAGKKIDNILKLCDIYKQTVYSPDNDLYDARTNVRRGINAYRIGTKRTLLDDNMIDFVD